MADLILYTNPYSRGGIANWMLEEVGQPWEARLVQFGEHRTPEFLALNPMGKVPTLVHGDVVVTEAAAICTYLADAFPDAGLAPDRDDPARGTYLRWLFFAASCVEHALVDKNFDQLRPDKRGMLGYGTYDDVVNALVQAITPGPWILGDRFTAADVYVGSQIRWGTVLFPLLDKRPEFLDYVARCEARPAWQRADALGTEHATTLAGC